MTSHEQPDDAVHPLRDTTPVEGETALPGLPLSAEREGAAHVEERNPIYRVLTWISEHFWWWYVPAITVFFAWISLSGIGTQESDGLRILIVGFFAVIGMAFTNMQTRHKVQTRYQRQLNNALRSNQRLRRKVEHEQWENDLLRIRLDDRNGK